MQRIPMDADWGFAEGMPPAIFTFFEDFQIKVDLPHDHTVSQPPEKDCPEGEACGFMPGTIATYMKFFDVPDAWLDKRIYLETDGVYCNSEVNVNGHLVGMHPSGYVPWLFDLTPRVQAGKNRLTVFANNSATRNTRWYTGTGMYRHAYLRIGPQVHLSANPLFLQTESLQGKNAVVLAQVSAENHTEEEKEVCVKIGIYKDKGHNQAHDNKIVARGECVIYLPPHGKQTGRVRLSVSNAALWDTENPNLYVAEAELCMDGVGIDSDSTLFGIRTLSLTTENGFRLNGKPLKLKGGCIHHDNGILGAAAFYDSEVRRLKLHKENGFNAVRFAHNPMSSDMTEACDRLGILAFAEAFDVWAMQKNANDYHLYFTDWWERDLTAFIERDRNHPSIFCWSVGNEITERNGASGGAALCVRLAEKVRSLDNSRPVTAAVPSMFNGLIDMDALMVSREISKWQDFQNGMTPYTQSVWAKRTAAFCAPLDFVGYNYLEMRYESDKETFPERIICGTESFPDRIADIWEIVERNPHVIGDFVWTSWDYLGEAWIGMCVYPDNGTASDASLYPARTADCGCFDILGGERPALAYHRIAWGSKETYIAVEDPAVFGKTPTKTFWAWERRENSWYYPGYEHKPITVDAYTSAQEAELYVNGKFAAKAKVGASVKNVARFVTEYVPGEIEVVSLREGKEVSRQKLVTPGKVSQILLRADKTTLNADGQSLAFVEVLLADKDGNTVPVSDRTLRASVGGAATLQAFGSAVHATEQIYTDGTFAAYRGRLMAIVRSGYEKGKAELSVCAEELQASLVLTVK